MKMMSHTDSDHMARGPDAGLRLISRFRLSPSLDAARRRLQNRPGFFASLTREQAEAWFCSQEPEVLGHGPRRRLRD